MSVCYPLAWLHLSLCAHRIPPCAGLPHPPMCHGAPVSECKRWDDSVQTSGLEAGLAPPREGSGQTSACFYPRGEHSGPIKALQATHQGDWLLALRSGRFPPPVPPPAALLHRNPSDPAALAKTVTWGEESAPPLAFLVFPLIPIIARERGDSACAPASPPNVRESIVFVLTPKSS